jgi:hypothetical protein
MENIGYLTVIAELNQTKTKSALNEAISIEETKAYPFKMNKSIYLLCPVNSFKDSFKGIKSAHNPAGIQEGQGKKRRIQSG